ncbi:MAG: hypothetical protein ABEJ93_04135 [Candidatus Nanohalobium sp.]
MDKNEFYLKTSAGVLTAALSAAILVLNPPFKFAVSALFLAASITVFWKTHHDSVRTGRTRKMKAFLDVASALSELTVVWAGLFAVSAPVWIASAVASFVLLPELLIEKFTRQELFFGREVRTGFLLVGLCGGLLNSYLFFYSLIGLGLAGVFDCLYILFEAWSTE